MDNSTETPGERLLNYNHSRLIAVLDAPADVQRAVGELTSAGFAEALDVHDGAAGARLVDFDGTESGAIGRVSHALHQLTVEGDHMQRYERELLAGRSLIVLRTQDAEHSRRALDILKAHHGHFINEFKLLTVEMVQP